MSDAKRALVTGASAGIGAAYAEALAAAGYDLVLVARRDDRLRELADRLHKESSVNAEVLAADLASDSGLASVEAVLRSNPGVDFLVNNAGFGAYMPFAELPPERAEELLRVQALAPTRLTRAALDPMLKRGNGTVVNVASLLAFSGALPAPPLPHRATYAATKAYLVAFTQLLASELRDSGIRLQVLCPGIVRTEFHEVQGRDVSQIPSVSAEDIVTASLAGLERGDLVCIPTAEDNVVIDAWIAASTATFATGRAPIAARYRRAASGPG